MSNHRHSPRISRRGFLTAGGSALGLLMLGDPRLVIADTARQDMVRLTAGPATFSLEPYGPPEVSGIWGYNGRIPGPVLRYQQGDRLRLALDNALEEPTTIHWHGIRLPNAMDGVPNLTQDPVPPGGRFDYAFDIPDAGTYWYHPHANAPEQLGRGLSGPLVVEEREPYPADRDLLWYLDDWRLDREARVVSDFGNMHDVIHAGRIGNTVTLNGRLPGDIDVRPGERIRLRLVNAANGRIFALSFGDLPVHVIALDGQPVMPHEPENGRVVLGPGMRADLVIDCTGAAGKEVEVADDFYQGMGYVLTGLRLQGEPIRANVELPPPPPLPANPVPEPDPNTAERHEIVFAGGMRGNLPRDEMMALFQAGMAWTVNGTAIDHDGHHHNPPLITLARGAHCHITYRNDTRWHHPVHLHGHHFRVLSRNGRPEPYRPLHDTVLLNPLETIETAFVADNPGEWMLHCHVLEHHAGGMGGVVRVRG